MLQEQFDYVVVDTPPAFDDHVLAAFDQSDLVALLATLDIPALKNLKLTLETLDLLNYPRETVAVVLNRADSKVGLALERGREDAPGPDLGADPELARRSRLDQPRRADRARRPQAPGERGDQGSSPSSTSPPGTRRESSHPAASCGRTGAVCCAGRRRRHEPRRPPRRSRRRTRRRRARAGRRRGPRRRAPHAIAADVDPFADVKRTVHQALLDNLGPKLYDSRLTQTELEQKVRQTLQEVLGPGGDPAHGRGPRPHRPGDRRRHPRLRAAGALPARPGHHRGHGQRLRPHLHRARRAGSTRSTARSPTRRTCAAPSTRSSLGSAAASTSPARWSTPACRTAAASTPSSRRWRSTARC